MNNEDPERPAPAVEGGDGRGAVRRERRPDVPHAVDTEGEPLRMRREPPVDERDTDSERGPREPQEEPPKEQAPKEPPKNPMKTTGTIRTSIRTGNTTRPPKRSVIKPRGCGTGSPGSPASR